MRSDIPVGTRVQTPHGPGTVRRFTTTKPNNYGVGKIRVVVELDDGRWHYCAQNRLTVLATTPGGSP